MHQIIKCMLFSFNFFVYFFLAAHEVLIGLIKLSSFGNFNQRVMFSYSL